MCTKYSSAGDLFFLLSPETDPSHLMNSPTSFPSSKSDLAFLLLNIYYNFAVRAKSWKSRHWGGAAAAETTQECHPASQSAKPGQAKCRRATSLWSLPWQLWTLDAPWHSAAKPDHLSLFWWENQTNGSLEVYFSTANLLSKRREPLNSELARTHMHNT